MCPQPGRVVLRDPVSGKWSEYSRPLEIIEARRTGEVLPALRRLEELVEKRGLHAAGFIAYEAAPAFDAALHVRPQDDFPLVWFGVYEAPERVPAPLPPVGCTRPRDWAPAIDRAAYDTAIARIKGHISRGETYQVNFTMRLRAPFDEEAWPLFAALVRAQPDSHAAFVDTGRQAVCSVSPELFFSREGDLVTSRPMKGTAPRGRFTAEDRARGDWLRHSEKNRAENVMIVDMVRNDLGRVAETGSVGVPRLWETERHPTVWQMTSTVQARTEVPMVELLGALFPCASITGAPKVSTMRIIAALETEPRRIYTGCIGCLAPGRHARFNVAIRTVLVDREQGRAEYGVGGGILWESDAAEEYAECLDKARVLTEQPHDFALLETMRWTPDEGYALLDRHLRRLLDSADYFDFRLDQAAIEAALARHARDFGPSPQRVRLLASPDGGVRVTAEPLGANPVPLRLALAPAPVDSASRFLFHKTTSRGAYDAALRACPGADDVILWNEREEVTETCNGNLVVGLDGSLVTPPVECGLLPGTYRGYLLEQGSVREGVVGKDDLARAETLHRVNSVRGWEEALLLP